MPELPDVTAYVRCLERCVVGARLVRVRVRSPFLLRTVEPPIEAVEGQVVRAVRRLGKRIVLAFDDELALVIHLMIAGRFQWKAGGVEKLSKICLAAFDFEAGTLLLTEAGQKKRAALHVVRGAAALAAHDPGGLDVLSADAAVFVATLRRENRTLKRGLTDPRLFDGIGNAYSDEILHAARLSPVQLTSRLSDAEAERLFRAAQATLTRWMDELARRFAAKFPGPGDITAFRSEFAVHGRYGKPCLDCGDTVQRIRYAENETNYCPTCQTEGRVLADRSLSRLLKDDWPREARGVVPD
ncbi:MAG TPA: DNA-formamidopyrimidine glycosylase family protein [Phycisphaerae bacterium]|nr:DNA-formamidopyrimidine glycosylase family protein [Phycisphaerae bacterium]